MTKQELETQLGHMSDALDDLEASLKSALDDARTLRRTLENIPDLDELDNEESTNEAEK